MFEYIYIFAGNHWYAIIVNVSQLLFFGERAVGHVSADLPIASMLSLGTSTEILANAVKRDLIGMRV